MEQYVITDRIKKFIYTLLGVGTIAIIYAIASIFMASDDHHHHLAVQRFWSNMLIDGFFFMGISIIATFFLAVQYAAESAWTTVIKRIMEAVGSYFYIGAGVLVLVLIAGSLHFHHIYHWMDPELYIEGGEHYDAVIASKQGYLNQPFYWARTIIFLAIWAFFTNWFRKKSLEQDEIESVPGHFKNVRMAAFFLVFFGYTSSVAAWDWIMSIDTHWFSTLFGWYVFSGMWISSMIVITLLALHLHKKGYLPHLNSSHIHDLGKWMFAISFLWSYLFFSQFMLIWYSDIPEEVVYFQARINDYPFLFWGMFIVNFIFPMLILMDRDKKRNPILLVVMGCILLVGHWLDTYMLITPGTMKAEGTIGFIEIGMAIGFLGLFLMIVLRTLTKAPVMVKNHPFLEESLHHEIH